MPAIIMLDGSGTGFTVVVPLTLIVSPPFLYERMSWLPIENVPLGFDPDTVREDALPIVGGEILPLRVTIVVVSVTGDDVYELENWDDVPTLIAVDDSLLLSTRESLAAAVKGVDPTSTINVSALVAVEV